VINLALELRGREGRPVCSIWADDTNIEIDQTTGEVQIFNPGYHTLPLSREHAAALHAALTLYGDSTAQIAAMGDLVAAIQLHQDAAREEVTT